MPRHDISSRFHGLSTLFTSSANQIKALPKHFVQRFSPASPCHASPKHCNTHHHVSLPLPFNTRHFRGRARLCTSIAFRSLHSSACLCSSSHRFALQSCSLPCRYLACLFNAFALSFDSMPMPNFAFPPLRPTLHRLAVAMQFLSVPLQFFAYPVIAIAGLVGSVHCLCFSWLLHCFAFPCPRPASQCYSVAQRILTLPSQCFTLPSRCKTEQFNAFPQLRIA